MVEAATDLDNNNNDMALTKTEEKYYNNIIKLQNYGAISEAEAAFDGTGLGGRFTNTQELHVMKYDETMATQDKPKWEEAVEKEHTNMTQYNVWKAKMIDKLPKHAKILTSTWAMKKKATSSKYQAQLTACGFEQQDGIRCDSSLIASPVVNDLMI